MSARRDPGKPHARGSPPVVVTFDDASRLLDVVGEIDRFVAEGETREDMCARLLDLLTWEPRGVESLPAVELAPGRYADINILADGDLRHFVLMDVSDLMLQLQRNQQLGNELMLAQRRQVAQVRHQASGGADDGPMEGFRRGGQLLVGIAHDGRRTLATLAGNARRLQSLAGDDPEVRRSIAAIHEAVARLDALSVNALIALGEASTGDGGDANVTRLAALLQDTFALPALGRGLSFEVRTSGAVVNVGCDALQLRQLLVNLVAHAMDGVASGALRVALRAMPSYLEVELAAEPAGFSEQHFSALVTMAGAGAADGAGLGLAIGRRLLQSLHGRAEIVGRTAGGYELWFRVPAREQEGAA